MDLISRLRKTIKDHGLFMENESLLVAVSGGVDSMALLHALQYLGYPIYAAHVNYHLRGEDSDLDQQAVEDYCNATSIPFFVNHLELASGQGIQEKAREARYTWFSELRKDLKLNKVVTAHHLNDQAETVLFNLCRGSGLAGASGMALENNSVVRPLLFMPKEEIVAYAKENNVSYREDVSNQSLKYSRNRIRNAVFPSLTEVNSAFVNHIGGFSHHASQADLLISEVAKSKWDSNNKKTANGFQLDLRFLEGSDYSDLLLYYMLAELEPRPSLRNEVVNLARSAVGKKVAGSNYVFWRDRISLVIESVEKEEELTTEIIVQGTGIYAYKNGSLCITESVFDSTEKPNVNLIYLPLEYGSKKLSIRVWESGDSIRPFGMKGRQKVSDILIQKKVPMPEKSNVTVLECEGEILWVLGLRASEFTRVFESKNKELKLLITT